jgi:hypothetical protein
MEIKILETIRESKKMKDLEFQYKVLEKNIGKVELLEIDNFILFSYFGFSKETQIILQEPGSEYGFLLRNNIKVGYFKSDYKKLKSILQRVNL